MSACVALHPTGDGNQEQSSPACCAVLPVALTRTLSLLPCVVFSSVEAKARFRVQHSPFSYQTTKLPEKNKQTPKNPQRTHHNTNKKKPQQQTKKTPNPPKKPQTAFDTKKRSVLQQGVKLLPDPCGVWDAERHQHCIAMLHKQSWEAGLPALPPENLVKRF